MTPSIGRSIKQGFWATNRSWAAMGFVAATWILMLLAAVLIGALTDFPRELLHAAKTERPATVRRTTTATPAPTLSPAKEAARQEWAERDRLTFEWLKRAWPLLVIGLLLSMGVQLWLYGGQIGYLDKLIVTQHATLTDFGTIGTRSFGALLGAGFLFSLLFVLVIALSLVLTTALSVITLQWVRLLLGILGPLVILTAFLWLCIRLSFWLIAVVVDRIGPMAGLNASFQASRGHCWRIVGLMSLLLLIFLGAYIPLGMLQFIGRTIGVPAGAAVGIIAQVLNGLIVNLYLTFAMTAAYIQCYLDAKSATVSAQAPQSGS